MHINSPGGIVTSGLAIYDTMEYIRPDVSTSVSARPLRWAAAVNRRGGRQAIQPAECAHYDAPAQRRFSGTGNRHEIREILDLRRRLNGIYEKHTGKTLKQIEKIMERDTFMTAQDAQEFGLIDAVVEKRPPPTATARHFSRFRHVFCKCRGWAVAEYH